MDINYKKVEKLENKLDDKEHQIAEQHGMILNYQAHHDFFKEQNIWQKIEKTGCSFM